MWWSCHPMQCDCLCCIMSRDAIRCLGDELLSVVPCNGMECYELKMLLVVRSHCVVRSGFVTMWWSKVLFCTTKYGSVLQKTTPVLLCKYYKVLLQYFSVQQRTTAVLLCSTKYYSSTSLDYKVLPYYSVLQNTTPVLLCTTKHYSVQQSSTTYYNILLQFYSILQSTTPVLLRTTPVLLQYYSVLQSTTLDYQVLLRTTPVLLCTTKNYSSTTLHYKVLLQ